MSAEKKSTLLLIGQDNMLHYLLKRYAEQSGYNTLAYQTVASILEMRAVKPIAIVFLSTELLEASQGFVEEMTSHETPILVCSSDGDEARARELGADYCLLHPFTYDDFHAALLATGVSK